MFIEETGFELGLTASVPEIRAVNEDGGVAAAIRRKLRVVDRDAPPARFRLWSVLLLPNFEVKVASYGVRDSSVRIDALLPFLDSAR